MQPYIPRTYCSKHPSQIYIQGKSTCPKCDIIKAANQRDRHRDYIRPDAEDHKFYSSKEWKKTRAAFRKINPLCKICTDNNRTTAATLVDHIQEIKDGGDKLSFDNLQALCCKCHNIKTADASRKRDKSSN